MIPVPPGASAVAIFPFPRWTQESRHRLQREHCDHEVHGWRQDLDQLPGAPGGDDYQNLWINPNHPDIILLVSDQGALVTVNGGSTWSSWYNQPTAQLYHVAVTNTFPYRVCGGQQESGSVCISSRGNDGEITFRDWHPVGIIEYGYVAPDPLDPDVIYGRRPRRSL